MDHHPQVLKAGSLVCEPDAVVDVTSVIARYGSEILSLLELPTVPLDDVEFELQRFSKTERAAATLYRLGVHVPKKRNDDNLSATSKTQRTTELGWLPVDFCRHRIGTIVLSEDDCELLNERRCRLPARSLWESTCQTVARLWQQWAYNDRPVGLSISDIAEIMRRHAQEKRRTFEWRRGSLTTLGDSWQASRMLVELLNRRYNHLGANLHEKMEIRWYLLEKAGYLPGAS